MTTVKQEHATCFCDDVLLGAGREHHLGDSVQIAFRLEEFRKRCHKQRDFINVKLTCFEM